jgi:hypothetical protein
MRVKHIMNMSYSLYTIFMSEIPNTEHTTPPKESFSRPVRFDDLFDEKKPVQNNYSDRHNTQNIIEKNQQEFGNRKRIKP